MRLEEELSPEPSKNPKKEDGIQAFIFSVIAVLIGLILL